MVTKERLQSIPKEFWKYESIFQEESEATFPPRRPGVDHTIPLDKDFSLRKQKLRLRNPEKLAAERRTLQEWKDKGWIRPGSGPGGSHLFHVPKRPPPKDPKKSKWRPVVNYRDLNRHTQKDAYPIPLIQELRDRMAGSKYKTKLDAKNGDENIRMAEG